MTLYKPAAFAAMLDSNVQLTAYSFENHKLWRVLLKLNEH